MTITERNIAIEAFKKTCARRGLKITPQRIAVFAELLEAKDHPSADVLYRRVRKTFTNISFDTVYRSLISFVELGLAKLVTTYDERKRFEARIQDHHHCICIKCQKIIDFYSEEYDALQVPTTLGIQFQVMNKRVVLEGICSDCKGK
jgi:Fur family transcriptional regulator, peroxide stress response regulator